MSLNSLIYTKQFVRSRYLAPITSDFSAWRARFRCKKTFCLIIESISQLKMYFNTVVKSFLIFKLTFKKNVLNVKFCELKQVNILKISMCEN